jgi:hypothetical protein
MNMFHKTCSLEHGLRSYCPPLLAIPSPRPRASARDSTTRRRLVSLGPPSHDLVRRHPRSETSSSRLQRLSPSLARASRTLLERRPTASVPLPRAPVAIARSSAIRRPSVARPRRRDPAGPRSELDGNPGSASASRSARAERPPAGASGHSPDAAAGEPLHCPGDRRPVRRTTRSVGLRGVTRVRRIHHGLARSDHSLGPAVSGALPRACSSPTPALSRRDSRRSAHASRTSRSHHSPQARHDRDAAALLIAPYAGAGPPVLIY